MFHGWQHINQNFRVIVMNDENEFEFQEELNYEDMDDLALPDHIEWNNEQNESFTLEALDIMVL